MVGFAMETPSISVPAEPVSYLEPWMADEEAAFRLSTYRPCLAPGSPLRRASVFHLIRG